MTAPGIHGPLPEPEHEMSTPRSVALLLFFGFGVPSILVALYVGAHALGL